MTDGGGTNDLSDDRLVVIDSHMCGLPGVGFGGSVGHALWVTTTP
jgi:hypothetical protein